MTHGFVMRRLTLQGPLVPPAHLEFFTGLNVISGPSDTGKTFVAECLDFVMGSGKRPKEIPQANGYEEVSLAIETRSGRVLTLGRALRGGDVRLSEHGKPDFLLSAKHVTGKDDSVSSFLIELCGLAGRKIRTNQRGTTRALTFRDIARLAIVDEESVISATSPVLTGQYTAKTAECGVFRLLLTGTDDSSVVSKEDPKVSKSRNEGKVEVLQALRHRAQLQLEQTGEREEIGAVRTRLDGLEAELEGATNEMVVDQGLVADVEERRRANWADLRQIDSKITVFAELQGRFYLLQSHYHSDLRRLATIAESGSRLAQLTAEPCPICGAEADHHSDDYRHSMASPESVAQSCRAETGKINSLLGDLKKTLSDNASQLDELERRQATKKIELQERGDLLKEMLEPRLQSSAQRLRAIQNSIDICRRRMNLHERLDELNFLLGEVSAPIAAAKVDGPSSIVSAGEAEQLCKEIEALLRSWHYPNLDRVTFSEEDQDIVISGRPRGSHGKGVRALTRAAFNLGLLRYCARGSRPNPGFVLIDSPLVVYREPDTDESSFPLDVKDAFYRSLAADFSDLQVIILENDDPPADLKSAANVVTFTGTNSGRRGFIS